MEKSDKVDNYFVDPFGALYMKILATVAYILGLPGCGVVLCFIWYETSGRAGPYRTCINQLVSRMYFLVIFHCGIIQLIDLVRIWYGPLPDLICTSLQVTRHTIYMTASLLWTVVALLKVWIVCIRKSVPTMDDNFVVTFVTRASVMMSFLFSLVGVILPQKPAFYQWICNGKYGPAEHDLKRTFPVAAILIGMGLTSTVVSAILVFIQRRKLERLENMALVTKYPNRITRSMESLIGNCTVAVLVMLTATSSVLFKIPIKEMDQFPYSLFVLEHIFICPLFISVFLGSVIMYQHGKVLKRSLMQR